MTEVVLAPVAFIKRDGGGVPLAVEHGSPVPADDADREHVAHLRELGVLGSPVPDTAAAAVTEAGGEKPAPPAATASKAPAKDGSKADPSS